MLKQGITWKLAIAGGAVLGAGFGSVALAGADASNPPGTVQLSSVIQDLTSPGAPVSAPKPAGISAPAPVASVAPSVDTSVAPSVASAPAMNDDTSVASIDPAPAPQVDDDDSVASVQPAPAPEVDDSPASPVSVSSDDSDDEDDSDD